MRQRTLSRQLVFDGVGIHTGSRSRIVLHPEEENAGVRFYKEGVYVPARYEFVVNTAHSTDLARSGKLIKTVEHLLASLHLLGITNLTIEVTGPEVPILDGSSLVYYEELKKFVREQNATLEPFVVTRPVTVRAGDKFVKALPSEQLVVSYEGEFNNFLGRQSYTYRGRPEEVVPARTFCFEWEIERIKSMGLGRGGSLSNTLVLGKERVYNEDGMRFAEEPVRHKVLDLIGDLYLLGRPVKGSFFSFKGGHALNYELVKKLAREGSRVRTSEWRQTKV
ncbi:MAG: UDP-3-O-[3-hydroxymyristoyl] N-acetylglucosamine deacetylase [Aquificae bacterium]|nr:UDP-3-O-[3-hydroxymyristoyl] N-acetylglucosamine deacetylase [Aquificota bacterium]